MGTGGTSWDTWILTVLEWLTIAGGLAAIVWCFWGRRGDAARCCPKCAYDMDGVQSRRCPECGHEVKTERDLTRRRARWSRLVLGVSLLIASWGIWVPGRVTREGVKALIPTSALVLATPWFVPEQITRSTTPGVQDQAVSAPEKYELFRTLTERIRTGELGLPHWEYISRHALKQDAKELVAVRTVGNRGWARLMAIGLGRGEVRPGLMNRLMDVASIDVTTRDEWAADAKASVAIDVRIWDPQADPRSVCVRVVDAEGRVLGQQVVQTLLAPARSQMQTGRQLGWWDDRLELDADPTGGGAAVSGELTAELVRVDSSGVASAPFASKKFTIVRSEKKRAEMLKAIKSLELRATLEENVFGDRSRIPGATVARMLERGEPLFAIVRMSEPAAELLKDASIGAKVEVFCGTELRYTSTVRFRLDDSDLHWRMGSPLVKVGAGAGPCEGPWRVVLRSDPDVAMRDFESTAYWEGLTVGEIRKTEGK